MRRAILGTAGHIDHGKTALVRALTGVDTDRLPEEKARGITIELGFAHLSRGDEIQLGVVDVPGHEDFIRTMVAGATGMDVVLLVVAADEGVMPQTREHLDILRLLGVPRLVVALTKADLVEPDWLALVEEDVGDFLVGTPYQGSEIHATSVRTGAGLDELRQALYQAAGSVRARVEDDAVRLPVDRSFTVQGMGTVVTGTLWSGTLSVGDKVRLLPGSSEARVRSLQVHGEGRDTARAGERTAVSLPGVDRAETPRGQVLVTHGAWEAGWMLTTHVGLLESAPRPLEHGSRVRVLLGTAEVLARCAVLDEEASIPPGGEGWVQLRLEEPVLARAGDGVVLRSYSPLVTMGGGVVAEATPAKRRRLGPADAEALLHLVSGTDHERVAAALTLAGWEGVPTEALTQRAGVSPSKIPGYLEAVTAVGGVLARSRAFSPHIVAQASTAILEALDREHAADSLRSAIPPERLRASVPAWASPVLADAVLDRLAGGAQVDTVPGGIRRPGYTPVPTEDQATALEQLARCYGDAGLAAPFLDDLPPALARRPDLAQLLRYMEEQGEVRTVDDGLWVSTGALDQAAQAVTQALGGSKELGPADFRQVLDVSRRHLMPLLAYLDGKGVTLREGPVRSVPGPK